MKNTEKVLYTGVSPSECSCIPHVICIADFNTNYPNPNRISRIAREVDEYLKYKYKNTNV
jgi:hypothetical protein